MDNDAIVQRALTENELYALKRQCDALCARVKAGEDNPRIRERIERIEAVRAALMGFPEVLAQ